MSNSLQMYLAERRELIALCSQLTSEQWNAPSLCAGWSVHDVVAHLGGQQHYGELFKGRIPFSVNAVNQKQVDIRRTWAVERLMAELQASLEPSALFKPATGYLLFDNWVHQQDIRWPLNLPRSQDPDRMRVLLKAGLSHGKKLVQGMRLVANDFDWSWGVGAEVVGPSEALVMMLAHRPSAWERLEGAGVARVSHQA
jgi:uncharacterized protein (TIGR03083 family)